MNKYLFANERSWELGVLFPVRRYCTGVRDWFSYSFWWLWFCLHLGCRRLSVSFWISFKGNLSVNCWWIGICRGKEGPWLPTLPSWSCPFWQGFYFTLIVDSFIVGRTLCCQFLFLSILMMFHCFLNSLVINEMSTN